MKRLACLGILLVLAVPTVDFAAATPTELAMVVTGSITVNPDGSVKDYAVDHPDKLPAGVRNLLTGALPAWKFDAIKSAHGTMPTQARMSVRVTGTVTETTKQKVGGEKVEQNTVQIGIADVALHCPPPHADVTYAQGCDPDGGLDRVGSRSTPPPEYPFEAVRAGMEGVVDLRLEIGRDGRVLHAAVREVKLYSRIPNLSLYREVFADPTLKAAQKWRFHVPTTGLAATRDHWVVDQRVRFYIDGSHVATIGYGQWLADLPGPIKNIPWAGNDIGPVTRMRDMTVEAHLIRQPQPMTAR